MEKKKEWRAPDGRIVDSYEEVEFFHWIQEAHKIGLIDRFRYHPQELLLAPSITRNDRFLMHDCKYTADFVLHCTEPFKKIDCGGLFSANGTDLWIDVKGTFSKFNDERYFSVIRKWVFQRYGIFINKVIPLEFFKKTFAPERLRYRKNGEVRAAYLGCATSSELWKRMHEQPELF